MDIQTVHRLVNEHVNGEKTADFISLLNIEEWFESMSNKVPIFVF